MKSGADGTTDRAQVLHSQAVIWDNHLCLPLRPGNPSFLPAVSRFREAGCSAVTINLGFGNHPLELHLAMAETFRDWFGARPDEYILGDDAGDVVRAKQDGKLAIFFDVEGAKVVEHDLSLIEKFYRLGVRWMLVAYNENNKIGGGCHDDDPGLTALGREWLAEMERVGMRPCCSHTGYRSALDVMESATAPVLLSHSNPRALRDHPRNVPDEVLKACAATGGVIGINGIGIFLGDNDNSTAAILRHIDYVVELAGPEHVGISLDYVVDMQEMDDFVAQANTFPPEWGYRPGIKIVAPEQYPEITAGLVDMGYPDDAILGILGGNWMRVMENRK